MQKVGCTGKVKATARIVTDKYLRVISGPKRLVASKLVGGPMRTDIDGLPFTGVTNPHSLLIYDTRTLMTLRLGVTLLPPP